MVLKGFDGFGNDEEFRLASNGFGSHRSVESIGRVGRLRMASNGSEGFRMTARGSKMFIVPFCAGARSFSSAQHCSFRVSNGWVGGIFSKEEMPRRQPGQGTG